MKQKIGNSSGFTLVEVLIASIIIVFGLLAMATFLGNLVSKNASNERKTMATSLAEQKIEDLRNLALNTNIGPGHDGNDAPPTAAGTFTRTWEIVEDAADDADSITVTVNWDGAGGNNDQVRLITLINN